MSANNVIDIIKDKDDELINPVIRYASRGIVIKDNVIAIFNKQKKNEYKLPGGGIENNETKEEAFYREIKEETGCDVLIIDYLGIIIEEKTKTNFRQISHVFVAKVISDKNELQLTSKEQDEGAKLLWLTIQDALSLMKKSLNNLKGSIYDSKYRSIFMVKRDIKILEYYLDKKRIVK